METLNALDTAKSRILNADDAFPQINDLIISKSLRSSWQDRLPLGILKNTISILYEGFILQKKV